MVDRVSAEIKLGGALPRAYFAELLGLIADEGLSADWDGEAFDPVEIPADMPVRLVAHLVAWGRFDRLEDFCLRHGLPFRRWSDASHRGFDAERVVFAGSGTPESWPTMTDGELVVTRSDVQAFGSIPAIHAWFEQADRPIPPLTIIDDDPDRGR